jgi:hypothetical protein
MLWWFDSLACKDNENTHIIDTTDTSSSLNMVDIVGNLTGIAENFRIFNKVLIPNNGGELSPI